MRYNCIPIRMCKLEKNDNTSCWGCGATNSADENVNC